MSLDENKGISPYIEEKDDRHKVTNLSGWGKQAKKPPFCSICHTKRYIIRENNYYCSNCGYEIPVTTLIEDKEKRLNLKHGPTTANTNPLIISQPKKKRRANRLDAQNGLDPETLDDLRNVGIDPASFRDYWPD
jgi:hypothetical protein